MPLDFRRFREEIEENGFSVERTAQGHYWVLTKTGGKLIIFAVSHKKNSGGEVYDSYLAKVRKAMKAYRNE